MTRLAAFALAAALCTTAAAQDTAPPAAPGQPELNAIAMDGLRACMSIAEGRTPAEAAQIFGFTPDPANAAQFIRETDRGKIEVSPPTADRKSCRTSVSALVFDNASMIDAVKEFLTTPPQTYAPLQMRIAESIGGGYAARTSIWAMSDGHTLSQVTLYEILADDYYHGPKVMIDHVVNRR